MGLLGGGLAGGNRSLREGFEDHGRLSLSVVPVALSLLSGLL